MESNLSLQQDLWLQHTGPRRIQYVKLSSIIVYNILWRSVTSASSSSFARLLRFFFVFTSCFWRVHFAFCSCTRANQQVRGCLYRFSIAVQFYYLTLVWFSLGLRVRGGVTTFAFAFVFVYLCVCGLFPNWTLGERVRE